ncbi:MAG TPA: hypothetical protein PLT82_00095 [Candidatus Hydrogenedens sp.]|nr:hypothetical protein [Candidatus Hydrogenedens sp.]HOK08705.1 hypothetical protein [Candidatus Hydrogenedens sp.]HOL18641.1 hypothetical protein [Candidatus Hydrogenedens sp.]HPP57513.1 hypothetical protein [Candidatus Hydrogenedens sp.]
MIEISITSAVIIYSVIIAFVGVFLWGLSEFGTRKIYTMFKNQNVWKCSYCAFVYLDTDAEEISQCPRCYSYNVASSIEMEVNDESGKEMEIEPRRNPSHKKRPHAQHRGPRRRR